MMDLCRKKKCLIRRDMDVSQLYLARRGLSSVPDLSGYSMLRCMWLNNNKIRDVRRTSFNCCLSELYLHNNHIISISGALKHLSCLRVLLLHNNQMKCLDEAVAELKNMQDLHTLSLYLNPFAQDPDYRQYVLHRLPSVQLLDRKEVKQGERRQALRIFSTERQRVLDSIAFGRRALSPPTGSNKIMKPAGQHGARNRRVNRRLNDTESSSMIRPAQKSIVQLSVMNWSGLRFEDSSGSRSKCQTQMVCRTLLSVSPSVSPTQETPMCNC